MLKKKNNNLVSVSHFHLQPWHENFKSVIINQNSNHRQPEIVWMRVREKEGVILSMGAMVQERPKLVKDSESEKPYNPKTWKKGSTMKYNGTEKKAGKAPVINLTSGLALPDALCNQKRECPRLAFNATRMCSHSYVDKSSQESSSSF